MSPGCRPTCAGTSTSTATTPSTCPTSPAPAGRYATPTHPKRTDPPGSRNPIAWLPQDCPGSPRFRGRRPAARNVELLRVLWGRVGLAAPLQRGLDRGAPVAQFAQFGLELLHGLFCARERQLVIVECLRQSLDLVLERVQAVFPALTRIGEVHPCLPRLLPVGGLGPGHDR